MPRKFGRNMAYQDDDYDDYDDYDYDYDEEEEEEIPAPSSSSSARHPYRASGASELGKALFSPLPAWKLKRTTANQQARGYWAIKDFVSSSPFVVSKNQDQNVLLSTSAQNLGLVPFKFDVPSPDDKVLASNSGTKGRTASSIARMQKPGPGKSAVLKTSAVTVDIQSKKGKASIFPSESSSGAKQEPLKTKSKSHHFGEFLKDGQGSDTQVLEGVMHMTLEGDQRERGNGREQMFVTQKQACDYVPESWILEEIKQARKPLLHLIVIGHVDAGKSTLMGHILHLLGRVPQKEMHKNERESKQKGKGSFAFAWVLDEGSEERARGVTMTVAAAHFESPKLRVVLLDAPGHKDFVPNMISGAAQADAAILVVDASIGAFESGLEGEGQSGGQTREHAQLVRSLGVEQLIVAVNKMDVVNYSQKRYEHIKGSLHSFLRQCGFKESGISWIPVSAMEGQNLVVRPSAASLQSWYSGPTLLELVDLFEEPLRNTLKPLRLIIAELVKSRGLGQAAVSGKLESGALRVGTKVLVMPIGEIATVKSIEQDGQPLSVALAGDSIDVGLTGVDIGVLTSGGVICHPEYPVPVVTRLELRVLVLGITVPILRGGQVVLHAHHAREAAHVADLVALLDSKTGVVVRKKPRCLTSNQSALIEITPERSLCLEEYAQVKALGRVALRDGGKTLAVGIVTRIIS